MQRLKTVVDVQDATTRLLELLELVEQGAEVIIARAGVPIARLSAYKREPRRPGYLSETDLSAIDSADAEIADLFNDSSLFPKQA